MSVKDDILYRLMDLHKQATSERSHYYTASIVRSAIEEIAKLRIQARPATEAAYLRDQAHRLVQHVDGLEDMLPVELECAKHRVLKLAQDMLMRAEALSPGVVEVVS